MRAALSEIIKQTSSLFPLLVVVNDTTTREFRGMTPDKSLILRCVPKFDLVGLEGEVAISDLSMLSGLLSFASYNTDAATFRVNRAERKGIEYAESMVFGDGKKAGATFRLTNPANIREEEIPPPIKSIPWELELVPEKSSVMEFSQLASLYSKTEPLFLPQTVDGDLHFSVGEENSSMHHASMVFAEDVGVTIKGVARYSIATFHTLAKIASPYPHKLCLTSRGVIGFQIETANATYDYILRATR
jgi:hypothetical protein